MSKLKTFFFGLAVAFLAAPTARAVVNVEEMFGGEETTGTNFATTAGLGEADLVTTIANIINVGLGFLGIVAVAIIILGGFKWVTAGGEAEKVSKAKKYIFQGLIGLVIVLAAYAIATFALGAILEAMEES